MYLAKVNYEKENVVQILSSVLKDVIDENTVIVCIGTDRAIGDALGPLVGTMLKNSDFKYPVYGTLDDPIHALNIYEAIDKISKTHSKGNFLAIDACLGSKSSIGNIQIREGPILPGKGVGKKLPLRWKSDREKFSASIKLYFWDQKHPGYLKGTQGKATWPQYNEVLSLYKRFSKRYNICNRKP